MSQIIMQPRGLRMVHEMRDVGSIMVYQLLPLSIRRRDGRLELALVVEGRRRRHCATSQTEAGRWLTQTQRARGEGINVLSRRLRLDAYLAEWLEKRRTERRHSAQGW
jgi:hypothetical protein